MSFNSFGHIFRFFTWGESHGAGIGVVVDGCPPGLSLSESDIQPFLDERRPGQSRYTTQRREADQVRILSGVFAGKTTGTPISLMIDNTDQRPKDYTQVASAYRPGHGDYSYDAKYGFRDYRGGGRASARETACRVAAGAIARLVIPQVTIYGWVSELGGDCIDEANFDRAEIVRNAFFCPDAAAAKRWESLIGGARKAGNSLGAVVECIAEDVPAGWGAPLYAKLDAELAGAMMGINAVKGVEIGAGFGAARLSGESAADAMRPPLVGEASSDARPPLVGEASSDARPPLVGEASSDARPPLVGEASSNARPQFLANNSGGVAGGISTGQPVVVRVAFKPTSSILRPVATITPAHEPVMIATKGRHDPCVAIRGVPVVAAMMALVLADQKLLHRAQCG